MLRPSPIEHSSLAQDPPPDTLLPDGESPVSGLVEGITDLETACGPESSWFCQWVFEQTQNQQAAGAAEWFIAKPVAIVAVILVAMVVSRLLRGVARRAVTRFLARDPESRRQRKLRKRAPAVLVSTAPMQVRREARTTTLVAVSRGIVTILVWFIAITQILGILEVDLTPLLAGAGILGLAVGFGAQNLVRDAVAGIFIILEDQYGVGDIIDVGEATGTVERITIRVTRLRDIHGVLWHVPNGVIQRVGNSSQEWARALLDIDVAYDSDLEHVQRALSRAADGLSADPHWQMEILDSPEVWGVERFGADGISVRLVVKTRPSSQWKVMRELRRRIKETFDEEGIEIPFPQRTVWMHTEEGTTDESASSSVPPIPKPPPYRGERVTSGGAAGEDISGGGGAEPSDADSDGDGDEPN
ncbi:MAG: mechanosensitive ion channel family protein [Acidimicrobiia bacterium]|nr:mechanosensitive ion channel family protein [Acidimicrobiia bacterium]